MSYQLIRATEIGEYVYCARAWWLRVEVGCLPQSIGGQLRGAEYQAAHGANVATAGRAMRIAMGLLFLAVGVFVFWLIRAT
jgi:hypothetical protein